jgi:hypothetical protein
MSDLTDSEKLSLLRRILRLRYPLPVLLLMMVAVIEPSIANRVHTACFRQM